jgi:hypothetical protein
MCPCTDHLSNLLLLQGFRTPEEVERFGAMMDEMCYIVATKHSGSLKVPSSVLLSHGPRCLSMYGPAAYQCTCPAMRGPWVHERGQMSM